MTTDNDNDLNIEIARLCGHETEEVFALRRPPVICYRPNGKDLLPIPEYATDSSAALGLLEYTLRRTFGDAKVIIVRIEQGVDAWYVELGLQWPNGTIEELAVGQGVVFERAIALACRDALAADGEREDQP